jgi:hypothetical protein
VVEYFIVPVIHESQWDYLYLLIAESMYVLVSAAALMAAAVVLPHHQYDSWDVNAT